ncbi:MAG: carbon-nitrogen hydrolase [Bacteroidales bacterium]|nr:carbon-nitrogen hydrolase [Bacteroidales bacterium]
MSADPVSSVKVGIVQMACCDDRLANMGKACAAIREAASRGAQIICLQELFSSLYFCFEEDYRHFGLAEEIPGPAVTLLSGLAEELKVVIVASLFEKRTQGIYHNTVAVIDADGRYLGKYRKQHIPDDPGYYEKFYFTPGDGGYKVFETRYAKIGTLICWDQWYPEAARITALLGAQIIFYPTAIGWSSGQPGLLNQQQFQAWQTIQRSHAIANGVYVVSVNRTGTEGDMHFWGGSFISGPFGEMLYEAPQDGEVVHVEPLNLSTIDKIRVHWPFLRDRRIDGYGPILQRFMDE